ncbi:MAG: hypothetical protein Q4D60_03840 [Eubacteriales bacterium]|nr:hypothetical protein [Eubacteriales bacterium]
MNKQRRKRLGEAFDKLSEIQEILEEVKNDEQEAYDNLPESFQYGERGEEMQNYIEMIEEVDGYIEDAKSVIEQI